MNKKLLGIITILVLGVSVLSCSNGVTESRKTIVNKNDTLSLAQIKMADSVSYSLGGVNDYKVYADIQVAYPKFYKDKESTDKLQKLFSETVLEIPSDSITLASALPVYMEGQLNQYKETSVQEDAEHDVDYEPVYAYGTNIKITVPFNSCGLVCFCKTEVTSKNRVKTMTRHMYYTFNLNKRSRIELNNLFSEEQISYISDMLKNKLKEQVGVKNEDELNSLGYYNFDNLTANNNFFLTDKGITWNYVPRSLSVIEEVKISLTYAELEPYISEQSVLSQFITKE